MKKPLLDECEWNFRECLDDEKGVCFHYEYARQFLLARPDLAKEWIGAKRKEKVFRFLNFDYSEKKQRSDGLPIYCDRFPALPWLKLPRKLRLGLLNLRQEQLLDEPGSDLLASNRWELGCLENFAEMRQKYYESWRQRATRWLNADGYEGDKRVSSSKILAACPTFALTPTHFYAYTGHINYALIALDWSKSNSDLKRAFTKLLKRRPSEWPNPAEAANQRTKSLKTYLKMHGGRGGPYDRLRQLAAMRLLQYCGSSENVVDYLSERGTYLPYKNARNVESAVRKARVTIEKMQADGRFWVFTEFA